MSAIKLKKVMGTTAFCVALIFLVAFTPTAQAKLNGYSDPKELRAYLDRLNERIKKNPRTAAHYAAKAEIQEWLHEYDEALTSINKAIELNPKDPVSYFQRGLIYKGLVVSGASSPNSKLHHTTDAMNDFSLAIELGQKGAWVYVERAGAKLILEDYKGALEDANIAVEREGSDPSPDSLYYKGIAEQNLGDYRHAIDSLSKAIELSGPHPHRHLNTLTDNYGHRGRCYEKIGEIDKAKADYAKAAELKQEAPAEASVERDRKQ